MPTNRQIAAKAVANANRRSVTLKARQPLVTLRASTVPSGKVYRRRPKHTNADA